MTDHAISVPEPEPPRRGAIPVPARQSADSSAASAFGATSTENAERTESVRNGQATDAGSTIRNAAASAVPDAPPSIIAQALRRIRPLSLDWAAVLAAAALALAVSLGWKVTW
jgi:hypothetical protein